MATPEQQQKRRTQQIGLPHILAGVRQVESGSYDGDYQKVGPYLGGHRYFGAYQISTTYWPQWAQLAGISGADMRSPQAQDRVAAFIIGQYYARYGSWDLATMAWFAGPQEAGKVARRGFSSIESIRNPEIREYVQSVADSAAYAWENQDVALTRRIPSFGFAEMQPGSGWVNPVAGKSEYSNSFYVPRDNNKTGIHGAIDIYAAQGTPIVSPVGGKVTSTKTGKLGGYTVRIAGDDGVTYYFAHMAAEAVVKRGQRVQAGHHLGYVGASGNAQGTSPHLHFSMRNGNDLVNPFTFLEGSGSLTAANPPNIDEMAVKTATTGMSGTMTSWLQEISDKVRASATVTEPEPEPEADSELGDKRQQQDTRTTDERRMV